MSAANGLDVYPALDARSVHGHHTTGLEFFAEAHDHKIAHREFCKTKPGGKAISEIEVDFPG